MVKYTERVLDQTFGALSDSTRRKILSRLAKGESTVCELAEPFDISLPAVTKHLNVLERAGLIHREKDGRIQRCTLETKSMKEAARWIEKYRIFWDKEFDALEKYLKENP